MSNAEIFGDGISDGKLMPAQIHANEFVVNSVLSIFHCRTAEACFLVAVNTGQMASKCSGMPASRQGPDPCP